MNIIIANVAIPLIVAKMTCVVAQKTTARKQIVNVAAQTTKTLMSLDIDISGVVRRVS